MHIVMYKYVSVIIVIHGVGNSVLFFRQSRCGLCGAAPWPGRPRELRAEPRNGSVDAYAAAADGLSSPRIIFHFQDVFFSFFSLFLSVLMFLILK